MVVSEYCSSVYNILQSYFNPLAQCFIDSQQCAPMAGNANWRVLFMQGINISLIFRPSLGSLYSSQAVPSLCHPYRVRRYLALLKSWPWSWLRLGVASDENQESIDVIILPCSLGYCPVPENDHFKSAYKGMVPPWFIRSLIHLHATALRHAGKIESQNGRLTRMGPRYWTGNNLNNNERV